MVEERGYRRQLNAQAGAPLPQVSPNAFGAGLGRAVEQAGEVVHREELEDARIDRDLRNNSEWSAYLIREAELAEEFDRHAIKARDSDEPGHAERLGQDWEKRQSEVIDGLTSQRLRDQAAARLAQRGGRLRSREELWEHGRQAEIMVERYQDQLGVAEGRVRRLETANEYAAEVSLQMDGIAGLAVSDKLKSALVDETEQKLAVSFIRGMIDRDPAAARALLDSAAFDGVLTGDQVEALRNGSEVEIRRAEAEARREQAAAAAQVRSSISYFKERHGNGFFEDEPEAYDEAIAAAGLVGDEVLVEQLIDLKADRVFGEIWGPRNANALMRQQRIGQLRGQERLSDDEVRELRFLEEHSPGWAGRERSDPVGQLLEQGALGGVVLDPSNPDSFAERARSVEGHFPGQNISPLSREEGEMLSRMFDSGEQGRIQVLDLLANFSPSQAMAAARMMDPQDQALPVIATLNPNQRSTALRGRDLLQANRKFLQERVGNSQEDAEIETSEPLALFNQALQAVPADQRQGVQLAAEAYLAGTIERIGSRWSSEDYLAALNFVLGAQGRGADQRGGMALWGEQSYLLPDGATAQEFTSSVVRDARDSEDPPVNPDGSAARLSRAVPVRVGPNLYQFQTGAGNPVLTESGQIYLFEFGQSAGVEAQR